MTTTESREGLLGASVDFYARRFLACVGERDALRTELERTEGDLAVAVREATQTRQALRDEALIRRAICDPGQFLPRGDDYTEPVTSWSARAVVAALAGVTPSPVHNHGTEEAAGLACAESAASGRLVGECTREATL